MPEVPGHRPSASIFLGRLYREPCSRLPIPSRKPGGEAPPWILLAIGTALAVLRLGEADVRERSLEHMRNDTRWTIGVATTTLLTCVLMMVSGPAMAQQPPPAAPATGLTPLSAGDRQFVMNAVRGSEREVELGDLAKEKAQRPAIKEFAARMV